MFTSFEFKILQKAAFAIGQHNEKAGYAFILEAIRLKAGDQLERTANRIAMRANQQLHDITKVCGFSEDTDSRYFDVSAKLDELPKGAAWKEQDSKRVRSVPMIPEVPKIPDKSFSDL